VVNEETLVEVATTAGVRFDFEGLDASHVENALTEALARFCDQRADELRSEGRIGRSGGVGQFIRDLLGLPVPPLSSQPASTRASIALKEAGAVSRAVEKEPRASERRFGRDANALTKAESRSGASQNAADGLAQRPRPKLFQRTVAQLYPRKGRRAARAQAVATPGTAGDLPLIGIDRRRTIPHRLRGRAQKVCRPEPSRPNRLVAELACLTRGVRSSCLRANYANRRLRNFTPSPASASGDGAIGLQMRAPLQRSGISGLNPSITTARS